MSLQSDIIKAWAFSYKNWIMARRNVFTLMEILFWPVIGLVSVGFMTFYLDLDPDTIAFILIGAISLSAVQVAQLDVAYVLLFDVWSKSIKHIFIAPVSGKHMVLGAWAMGIVRGTGVFLFLGIFSFYYFGFDFLKPGLVNLAVFLLGLFLNGLLIGAIVCIMVLSFGQRAEVAAWTLVGFMMLVCGVYYPVTVLPPVVQMISKLVPLTYFLEYFRSFYSFPPNFAFPLEKGYLLSVMYSLLALVILKYATLRARRTGLLMKLSE